MQRPLDGTVSAAVYPVRVHQTQSMLNCVQQPPLQALQSQLGSGHAATETHARPPPYSEAATSSFWLLVIDCGALISSTRQPRARSFAILTAHVQSRARNLHMAWGVALGFLGAMRARPLPSQTKLGYRLLRARSMTSQASRTGRAARRSHRGAKRAREGAGKWQVDGNLPHESRGIRCAAACWLQAYGEGGGGRPDPSRRNVGLHATTKRQTRRAACAFPLVAPCQSTPSQMLEPQVLTQAHFEKCLEAEQQRDGKGERLRVGYSRCRDWGRRRQQDRRNALEHQAPEMNGLRSPLP